MRGPLTSRTERLSDSPMLRIHHARRARSARVIWLCEELGLPYELATFEFKPENLKRPEYLRLHPLGQVPVVEDGGVVLFESGAILEWLLEKYGAGRLQPATGAPERARYLQWFHFGEAGLARHIGEIVRNRFTRPEAERNAAVVEESRGRFREALGVVERELAGKQYVLGGDFSAADIMIGYGIVMARIVGELPEGFPEARAYLERLKARPAYARAWA